MTDLIDTLESEAINSPQERPVFRRVARIEQVIYIDLGTPEGEVVEIDEKGWQVRTDTPVAFLRDGGFRPLPAPVPGGDIADLKSILQLGDENWVLVLGFLLNCLRGEGPFMCLIVEGQQGSGKSFLCEVIKRLIDPNAAARLNLSQDTREVMLQARSFYLPVYDNASGMKGDVADTLCTIATGGAIVKRSLYTDAELCSISAQRPFIMNGIGDYATRADLLERAIPIELPALATRLTEAALLSRLETKAPEILGALYDAVSQGLRNIDRVVLPTGPSPRMIDAARWITAAEPAGASGTFVKRLNTKQADVAVERITNEPLYAALDNTITYPFHGSMSELLRKLNPGEKFQHSLPQTPAALSKLVKRLAPQLGYAGIHVRFEERTNNCRPVTIWKDGQTPPAPRFSTPRTQRLSSLIGGLTRTRLDA